MQCFHLADQRFLAGLAQHGFSVDYGLRLLNTGFVTTPFGERWQTSPVLRDARASGRPYYIDRITGGMPFQPLDGIREIALALRDDPRFLGFQVHEWDNSPMYDYRRVNTLFHDRGVPFDAAHFAEYAGRTSFPYFSGGDYAMYRDLHRPLATLPDVADYLERYFSRLLDLTAGQVMAVNGNAQLYHAALRLGAKHVMAEIGNQVPLTAMQIACARGAARAHGKPFGVYYETWGGAPFGCTCATDFSPWFATREQFNAFHDMGSVGPAFGSGRSLQARLLYFAWLSGAARWVEEWGAENYFHDWECYPLTDYGRTMQAFADVARAFGPVTPVVPAALVLPPGVFGIDTGYLAGARDRLFGIAEPDAWHEKLRWFVREVLAPQPLIEGRDAQNLTPSPWIGCFDILADDAPAGLLSQYAVRLYLDEAQMRQANDGAMVCSLDQPDALPRALAAAQAALPFRIGGDVGSAQARAERGWLVGLFNNLGVTKTADGETFDPAAHRAVTVDGPCAGLTMLAGGDCLRDHSNRRAIFELPAGAVAVFHVEEV